MTARCPTDAERGAVQRGDRLPRAVVAGDGPARWPRTRRHTGNGASPASLESAEEMARQCSTDKTLLITGGTGTFGNAVLRRFLDTDIARSGSSAATRRSRRTCGSRYNNPKLKFYIGDVRDYDSVAAAMDGVDYVFHAAALKQVPSCEFYPLEALRTNALGAENVLNAAIAAASSA